MAVEPGGRANKLGNEYERLWGVFQLLQVVGGEATSVLPEGLGPDEKGVDVWVRQTDGKRVGYQCKRENGTNGKWSIADLQREGILANAKFQLDRGDEYRFAFVSSDPAPILNDLCGRTKRCNNDPAVYAKHSVKTSANHARAFKQVSEYLGFDPEKPHDQAGIFDFLSRTEIVSFDRGRPARKEARAWARLTVEGDPRIVVSELGDFLLKNVGNELYGDRIRKFLRERGLHPRNLSGDPELLSSIERLQNRFRRSFALVGDKVISRPEATQLLNHLSSDENPRILCIHGRAGDGKSGVLYEITDMFDIVGTPFLALRLDRLKPSKTAEYFGKDVCSLPSSPAACLKAVSGERKAVLVLDQLDAIRWTSAHSSDAWNVCEELIEEALAYQNLSVIVACRTFDLDDDPRIRRWKTQKKVKSIAIGELPEGEVRKVVSEHGQDWNSFNSRQKKLLQSPQCLYLWTVLQNSGQPFSFHTATDLMRTYWEDVWKNRIPTLNVSVEDCNAVLKAVVSYMDDQGKLTAPTTILSSRLLKARDALVSLNILGVDEAGITFRHQSYLDFLIAEQTISGILADKGNVMDWLLETSQSLFRRDQLRQILALLRDQEGAVYEKSIRSIIERDEIRFHLKHLVLTLLGHCDPPTEPESDFVFELLDLPEWHRHIVDQVLWNKPAWFEAMDSRGIIEKWLGSENEQEIALAIIMMQQAISPKHGQRIVNRLRKFERASPPWPERLASLFRFNNPAEEPRNLFALRLRLMRRGLSVHSSADWKKLSQDDPKRCIVLFKVSVMQLIASYRDLRSPISGDKLPSSRLFRWPDIPHIASAAEKVPLYTWKGLIRCMTNRRNLITSATKRFQPYDDVDSARMQNKFRLPETLLASAEIVGAAGKVLAAMQPGEFFDEVKVNFNLLSKNFQRTAVRAMTAVPDEWSDVAIAWLCDHPACFEIGEGMGPSRWEPASKVIERFSAVCSEKVFQRLEGTILAYRSPDLRSSFEWQRESLRKNRIVGNDFGRAQYALLQAVARQRSPKAMSLLRQWDRKFRLFPLYSGPRSQGGWITSPIPREALHRVTDKQWLEIIKKDWSERGMRWKSMGADHVGEANHQQFSRDMREMARWQPQRFAELARRIPKEAYPGYLDAIVSALDLTGPPKPQADSGKSFHWQSTLAASWQPATSRQMEAVLDYVGVSDDRDQAISYCRLIERRSDANWSPGALKRLIQYAIEHPDPIAERFPSKKTGKNGEDGSRILTRAINCVRGCAAEAIHRLLFQWPESFHTFLPAIQHLVQDASPPVRVAAIGVCLPVLNIDRDMAVDLFVRACEIDDDRIFESRYANDFIAYARHSHLHRLEPIIERMIKSDNQKVASCGAAWATGTWLETGRLESWMSACKHGTVPQRIGVADVVSHWISEKEDEDFIQKCITLLKMLFNDGSSEVRNKAASVFHSEDIFHRSEIITLSQQFVDTRAFDDDPSRLFLALESYTGNLRFYAGTILKGCEKLSGFEMEISNGVSRNIVGCTMELSSLLLRLYEQSQDPGDRGLQTLCLDAWDMIIRSRTGGLYGVLEKIDS